MTDSKRRLINAARDQRAPIKVAQFGLGPIGVESLRLLADKSWAKIVGGVDIDPTKTGRSLAELGAGERFEKQQCYPSFRDLWANEQPDVIIHTAGSKIGPAVEQIIPMASAGVSVVSSCEELLFPYRRDYDAAMELDRVCKESGARVVGTGVNPGFVMDLLPVCLTGVSRSVEEIHIQRVVNASTRRLPLQKKIGSGMAPEEFRLLFTMGKAGHQGFQESAALVAHCMGWEVDAITETCDPVVAEQDILTKHFHVKRGQTCGLHQQAAVIVKGRVRITMDLKMYLDAKDPHDAVQVVGDPALNLRIAGGVAGDDATVAALANAVPRVMMVSPGLRLMTDLPVPSFA
ncbi:MAG: dihydrodipicolinate reductase [Anaerolineae bacterium]|nr:dihydrodipicolinate reductase [Phycisphaerae bacterium]